MNFHFSLQLLENYKHPPFLWSHQKVQAIKSIVLYLKSIKCNVTFLHLFTLNNKKTERLTKVLSSPTGDLVTLSKLRTALGAY